jgi:hypothetical protein
LGIDDFIESCNQQIKFFNDIKNKVEDKNRMIEDIITAIESENIVKPFDFKKLERIELYEIS